MNRTIQFEIKPPLMIIFCLIPMLSTIGLSSHYFSFKGKVQGNALYLEKAIVLNPCNTRAYFDLASISLYKERDLKKSIYNINKLINYYPYNISGLTFLAKRQIQNKSWYKANNTINKILSFYPNYKQAQHMQVTIKRHL